MWCFGSCWSCGMTTTQTMVLRWILMVVVVVLLWCSEAHHFLHHQGSMDGSTEAHEEESGMDRRVDYSAELLKPVLLWGEMEEEGARMVHCGHDGSIKIDGSFDITDFAPGVVLVFPRTEFTDVLGCSAPSGMDPQVFAEITSVLHATESRAEVMTTIISGSEVVPHVHFSLGEPYVSDESDDSVRELVALGNSADHISKGFSTEILEGFEVAVTVGIDADVGEFDFFRDGFEVGIKFEVGATVSASAEFRFNILNQKFIEYNNTIFEFPIPSLATPQLEINAFLFKATFGAGFYGELGVVADLDLKIKTFIKYKATYTSRYEVVLKTGSLIPVDVNVLEGPDFDFGEDNGIFEPEDAQLVQATLTGFIGVRPALEAEIAFFGTVDADLGAEFGAKAVIEYKDPPFETNDDTGPIVFGDCDSCHFIEGRLQLVGQKFSFQSEVVNYEKVFLDGLFDINIGTACFWEAVCLGEEEEEQCTGECMFASDCAAEGGSISSNGGCDGALGCCEGTETVGCIMPGGQNGLCLTADACTSIGQQPIDGFCPEGTSCCIDEESPEAEGPEDCSVGDGREGTCISTAECDGLAKERVAGLCAGAADIQCCVEPSAPAACSVGDGRDGTCISTAECEGMSKDSVAGLCAGAVDIQCCVEPSAPAACSVGDGREGTCISTAECAGMSKDSVSGLCPGAEDIQCCVEPSAPAACSVGDGRDGTCISTAECAGMSKDSVSGLCPGAEDIQCCVEPSAPENCTVADGRAGTCITTTECAGMSKESYPGLCPGAADIQCCVSPPPGGGGGPIFFRRRAV